MFYNHSGYRDSGVLGIWSDHKGLMTEIIILITAIIFYFLGRWSVGKTFTKDKKETIDQIVEMAKTSKPKLKPGIIPFKTQEEFELERSGDKALEAEWIKSGKADLIKHETI